MPEHIEIAEPVAETEDVLVPAVMRRFCETEVKAVNKAEREVAHVITTTNPDRVGDVVEASGADLTNFMRHPVVVADHSYSIKDVIGRAKSLTVEDNRIFVRTKYLDTPLAKDAFNLAAEGLGAWSIGFRPISFKAMKDDKGLLKGFHFTKWELLEYSQVAVPMNPDAVQNAITRGLVRPENVAILLKSLPPASPDPIGDGPPEAHAKPSVPKSTPSRPTDRQLRRLSGIERTIRNHAAWEAIRALEVRIHG